MEPPTPQTTPPPTFNRMDNPDYEFGLRDIVAKRFWSNEIADLVCYYVSQMDRHDVDHNALLEMTPLPQCITNIITEYLIPKSQIIFNTSSPTDDIKGIILKQNGDVQIGDDEDHTLQNAVVLVDWEPYNEPSSIAHYGEDDVHVRVVSQPFWNANQQNLLANGWYRLAPPTPLAQPTPQTTTTKKKKTLGSIIMRPQYRPMTPELTNSLKPTVAGNILSLCRTHTHTVLLVGICCIRTEDYCPVVRVVIFGSS
jgi:hypothetical protein